MYATSWLMYKSYISKLMDLIFPQLDKNVLYHWSINDPNYVNASLVKKFCKYQTMSNGGKAGILNSCSFLFADTSLADTSVSLYEDRPPVGQFG